ncbi:MAG: PASTA domain-containing protein [Gammaproteobacteria bacterium]|nr:PASTA domain-containing protein [Gammaproteobacteria bacterium]
MTTAGAVLRVDENDQARLLAQVNEHLEGVIVVPDDSRYGDLAGRIISGAEDSGRLYAIDRDGTVTVYSNLGVAIEDIDLIPENENFFGANYGSGNVLGVEAVQWRGYAGKILLTQEFPAAGTSGLYVLEWDNGPSVSPLPLSSESFVPAQWEHVTFAPAGVAELGKPAICSLQGDPDLVPSTPLVDVSACPGLVSISSRVGNVGLGVARAGSAVDFSVDGVQFGRITLSRDLAPGEFQEFTVSSDSFVPFAQPVSVTADVDRVLRESDELNNVASGVLGICAFGCVENFQVRVKRDQVQLTWDPVTDASYEVLRAASAAGPFEKIADTTSGYSTYLDLGAPQGQVSYYKLIRSPGELGQQSCESELIAALVPSARSRVRAVSVPDLRGLTQAEAGSALSGAGLQAGAVSSRPFDGEADGRVFEQDPPAGSSVASASRVALVLADNPPPTNTPPQIQALEAYPVDEGTTFIARGRFTDPDANRWSATVEFGDGGDPVELFLTPSNEFVFSHRYLDDGDFVARIALEDGAGGRDDEALPVTIRNVAPTVFAGSAVNLTRDRSFERDGFFTDPGADSWTATVDYGDGSPLQTLILNADKTFSLQHTYTTVGVFDVVVRVNDDDGDEGVASFAARVAPPTVNVPDLSGLDASQAEAALVALTLSLGAQSEVEDANVPAGQVRAQSPAAGSVVSEGFAVDVVLSLGDVNEPPALVSAPLTSVVEGRAYAYPVQAADPDGDTLGYSLEQAPVGMSIDPVSGLIEWLPDNSQIGQSRVTVRASDPGGLSATQSFNVQVLADVPVDVPLLEGLVRGQAEALLREAGLLVGQVVVVVDDSVAPGTVVAVDPAPGTTLQAGTEVMLTIATGDQSDAPSVSIDSPSPGTSWSAPVSVLATVSPATLGANAGTPIDWSLRLTPAGATSPQAGRLLAEGSGPLFGEAIASIDPTLLANDSYDLQLSYRQGAVGGRASVPVSIDGALKLGNFRLQFKDADFQLAGIPLAVSRSYDTLALEPTEFGFGWRLAYPAEVRDGAPDGRPFVYGTRVYVTLPDGERAGFRFTPRPTSFLTPWLVTVEFTPDPGVYGSLQAVGDSVAISSGGYIYFFSQLLGQGNPSTYRYTNRDGIAFTIDQKRGLLGVADQNGNELVFTEQGITHSSGIAIDFERDGQGRITRIVDPDGATVDYEYDANGDLVKVTDQLGTITSIEYDPDLPHFVSRVVRDGVLLIQPVFSMPEGRLVALCSEGDDLATLDGCTQIDADTVNGAEFIRDGDGRGVQVEYDDRGNITREVVVLADGSELVDQIQYDARGNLTRLEDAGGYVLALGYDSADRMTRVEEQGQVSDFSYNSCGEIASYTKNGQLLFTYEYDPSTCKQTKVIDAQGTRVENQYDSAGRERALIDAIGSRWDFSYDADGFLDHNQDPFGNVIDYDYLATGRLERKTDRNGRVTEFEYDSLGRLTHERWPGTNPLYVIEYEYDGNSRMIRAEDAQVRTDFEYNGRGNLALVKTTRKQLVPGSDQVIYGYDRADHIVRMVDSFGGETTFEYDAAERVTRATQQGARERSVQLEYDPSSLPRKLSYYSDLQSLNRVGWSEFDFECPGCEDRLNAIRHFDANGNPVASYTFQLNDRHDFVEVRTEQGLTSYGYDARRQLNAVTRDFASAALPNESYSYDANGNRLSSHFAGVHTYTGVGNRLTGNDDFSFEYDNEGNVTARVDRLSGERTGFEYDHRNRLLRVTRTPLAGSTTVIAEYLYDALNRRVAKRTPAGDRFYLNEGLNVLVEYDGAGNVLTRRFYEPSMPDGVWAHELDNDDRWLLADQVDSVNHTLDASGALAGSYVRSVFGVPLSASAGARLPSIFAGIEYEADVALYSMRSRFYDPAVGRFQSEDDLGFAGGDENLYRYVRNNPVTFVDPTGRAVFSENAILQRMALFQRLAIRCLGDAVFTNIGEAGVYLLIEAVALNKAGNQANVYAGKSKRKLSVRFSEHARNGRRIISEVPIYINKELANDPKALRTLEELLMKSFGGKAQLMNKVRASKKLFCR